MNAKKGHKKEIPEDVDNVVDETYNDDVVIDEETTGSDAIAKLRKKLKDCQSEKQEYLEGWQRARADFVNARKEDEKSRASLSAFASEELITDLLPVLDSFDMAFANKEAWEKVDETWRKGVEYIYSQLLSTLESRGVKVINPPEGSKLDLVRHVSLEVVDTDEDAKDDTVHSVLQRGYEMKDKVIRPAKVKVFVKK